MGNQQAEQPESVDRIRDIIFGPKMRDYDQRFEAIVRDLDRLQQELDGLTDKQTSQNAAQTKSSQTLRQELRQADSELRSELKQELARIETQMAEQNASQNEELQALRQELRKANADLREELRQIAQRLTGDKTDRSTLGDLFIELGNQVKSGGSLADLLKGLDQQG